ncbi:MAG: hypothetical protein VSS75_017625 [Candidatus Parabeggiatoa sp.]|nr:hypothetical protein [Candidatus Parabeggiatoa sp.]
MKIKEIIVEKLFDTFDHTISLKTEEGITLMLGENGFGKTVLLEMINALFNQNFFISNPLFSSVFNSNLRIIWFGKLSNPITKSR